MKIIDLTHTIRPGMPVYPGTEPPAFLPASSYEKDGFKETKITMFTHTGTHIDPPSHIFRGRTSLDAFPAEAFFGKAIVIDCTMLGDGELITLERLEPYGERLDEAEFLLFNTGWSKKWGTAEYFGDYPVLGFDVLEHVIGGGYKGIGLDVIGLDPIADWGLTRHKLLFRETDILNIENLCRLDECGTGIFDFGCFPLRIEECDGSPARALAWTE